MFSRAQKTPLAEWWWTIDRELLASLVILLFCGILLSFAASPPVAESLHQSPWFFVVRHIIFAAIALVILVATSFLTQRQARIVSLLVLVAGIVMLFATLKFGTSVKGATRWISALGLTIQPSELVKPAFAVIVAWLLSEKMRRDDVPAHILTLVALGLVVTPLVLQPDIGQTALVLATWTGLLFLAGLSWWLILGLIGLAGAGGFGAYTFFPHVSRRIDTFLSPGGESPYQVKVSLQSLLEGGWFGRGPGEALARRSLPDAHADYVFAAAAGEFGLLFCIVLVCLIAFITLRALMLAQAQQNTFPRLAASALALQFGLQSAINLAVNLNLIPPKGMTLPFVSYGGTSMLAVAFGMGLMLTMTRRKPAETIATGIPAYRAALEEAA